MTPSEAATELLRRRRARESLIDYAKAIDIPGVPLEDVPDDAAPDWLFKPVESGLAPHHLTILRETERCMLKPFGRLIIMAPPGSAKTTYATVVPPSWYMGKFPKSQIILGTYGSDLARRFGRRARQIVKSTGYRAIFGTSLAADTSAANEWHLDNGSEYLAGGMLSGMTGNRADGIIIDDPVKGRQEADSEVTRANTWDAWDSDLKTRLKPGGWVIIMQTRWQEDDLAGRILPDGYDGRSGVIRCRDGMDWMVLNIPAKAEHADDPIGRKPGEYLWPEWFPETHWKMFENDPRALRTWSALFQQRPSPDAGNKFKKEWFDRYDETNLPRTLKIYGATDDATTDDGGDYTEHGIIGLDVVGDIWMLDWWYDQKNTGETIEAMLNLVAKWRPLDWYNETGPIPKAIRPALLKRMRERNNREGVPFVNVEYLPHIGDKSAKAASFQARASAGTVHIPKNKPWADRLVAQLVAFPTAKHDDAVDVCGLFGRALDIMSNAKANRSDTDHGIKPFSRQWLEYEESQSDKPPRIF